jgi:hypothetical protein
MDSGADEDLIYLTGRSLSKAGIFELLPPSLLSLRLGGIDSDLLQHFFSSAGDYLQRVRQLVEAENREHRKRQLRHGRVLYKLVAASSLTVSGVAAGSNEPPRLDKTYEAAARALARNMAKKRSQLNGRFIFDDSRGLDDAEGASYLDADVARSVVMDAGVKRVVERAGTSLKSHGKNPRQRRQLLSIRQK